MYKNEMHNNGLDISPKMFTIALLLILLVLCVIGYFRMGKLFEYDKVPTKDSEKKGVSEDV